MIDYDNGGYLPPADRTVVNDTGRTERVFTAGQLVDAADFQPDPADENGTGGQPDCGLPDVNREGA